MKIFISLIFLSLAFNEIKGADLEPRTVYTQVGLSYVLIIREKNVVPNNCYVSNEKNQYFLIDLVIAGLPPQPVKLTDTYKSDETDIMTSLGNNICGFKMDNVSVNTTTKWTLTIAETSGKNYSKSAFIFLDEKQLGPLYRSSKVRIGDKATIKCTESDYERRNIDTCIIIHPKGQKVTEKLTPDVIGTQSCKYEIDISKTEDFGIWKCLVSYKSTMTPMVIQYELIQKDEDIVSTWYKETKTHAILGCSVKNPTMIGFPNYCVMFRPDGQQFKLAPGLATVRYTSLNTNLTNHSCSLEILKPLKAEEIGIWRCEQHGSGISSQPVGGFINTTQRKKTLFKLEPEIPKTIFVHINKTLSVSCRVPYSSSYCYMRDPNGVIYPIYELRSLSVGYCEYSKSLAELSDNGTWLCGFAKETGMPDDLYQFQVHIPEVIYIRPEKEKVIASLDRPTKLKCTTHGLGDYPLQYCRFLSPDGKMYQIGNHEKSKRFSYEGRGFEYGECGIKIHKLEDSDEGTWSCMTKIDSSLKKEEIYTNIHVSIDRDNLSLASVLGITFGVAFVTLAVGIFAFKKWRQRITGSGFNIAFSRNVVARSSNSSNSSNNSNTILNVNDFNSVQDYSTVRHRQNIENIQPSQ